MKRTAVIGITLLLFLSAYSAFMSFSLRKQAQEVAEDKPFCVQVPSRAGYTAATGIKDTLGLLMKGYGGYHHAVLVVRDVKSPVTYHWSYFRNQFVQGTYGPLPIVCVPSRDYFSNPVRYSNEDKLTFALHGKIFSIPKVFHPHPAWPGSMVGYGYLATAPSFVPASEACSKRLCNMVHVAFYGGATAEGWSKQSTTDRRIEDLGDVHGLMARRRTELRNKHYVYYDYIQRSPDGKTSTYITCFDVRTVQCAHLFSEGGLTYSFHHMPDDLPQWRTMQERLINLNRTFALEGETMLRHASSANGK